MYYPREPQTIAEHKACPVNEDVIDLPVAAPAVQAKDDRYCRDAGAGDGDPERGALAAGCKLDRLVVYLGAGVP